jgi:hypothetical protein
MPTILFIKELNKTNRAIIKKSASFQTWNSKNKYHIVYSIKFAKKTLKESN